MTLLTKSGDTTERGRRISAETLSIPAGIAMLEFDNRAVCFISGPAELSINSVDNWEIRSGNMVAQSVSPVSIRFGAGTLTTAEQTAVQLFNRATNEFELFLISGNAKVQSLDGARQLTMAKGKIDQVLVLPLPIERRSDSQLMVAKGNGQFQGQVSVGGKHIQVNSPNQLQAMVDTVTDLYENDPAETADTAVTQLAESFEPGSVSGTIDMGEGKGVASFNDLEGFLALAQQIPGNAAAEDPNASDSLSDKLDSLSTKYVIELKVNGQLVPSERINEILAQKKESLTPILDRLEKQVNRGGKGEIIVNGHSKRFSTPEEVEQARRELMQLGN
ncbi:MAG: hypothetical protein R3C03_18625 [Pirellulaceae bacterium]